ncbi:MAG TPA: M28 family peptidase [Acidobacteriota bacterium]|nr:M28 family peptidase [Acidobacteriota bacterium]
MPKRSRCFTLLLSLSLALASFGATHAFQPDAYLQHVKYLAGEDLQGRGDGTPELNKAAEYIAAQFKRCDLTPAGDEGSFLQRFQVNTGSQLGPVNKLTLRIGNNAIDASLNRDFIPFAFGDKTSASGDLVFAGYGISAEEHKYDDYKNLDVTDKIVLVMAHEPRENDPASAFNGRDLTLHGHDNMKVMNARYRNARAILIVQDPANHEDASKDLAEVAAGGQLDELGIPAVHITRSLAQRLFDEQGKDLLEIQKQIDEKLEPESFVLTGVQVDIQMDVIRVRKEVSNVVGLLPGNIPGIGEETVVIGAPYDHLGHGGRSSMSPQLIGQMHPGADDNASGTAGLLELASVLAKDPTPRRRGYVLIAFAGEELGLRGSEYWASHPTRPLEKVVAMINMDMIGRLRDDQIILGGVGTSPVFPGLVKSAAEEAGLKFKTSQSGYGSSDHVSFYTKNVPVLFFFSGLHSDYHRPSDTWDKINAEGATKILSMVYSVATQLDTMEIRPQFTKVDDQMTPGNVRAGGGMGYGAYFGSIPDMTDEVKGVRFSDVRPNSPAAKAGLKGQDVLIQFAGKEITNLEDFTYMLRTHKPGETVEVVVLRDGKPLTSKVTLEVRR